MRLLLGLVLLVALATLATSRRLWSLRRMPLIAVFSAGGWFSFCLGMVFGPSGIAVLREQDIYTLNHIAFFCLGWAGLAIGLQIRLGILSTLTKELVVTALCDTVLSILLCGLLYLVLLHVVLPTSNSSATLFSALLFAICSIGWSGEMRSLRMSGIRGHGRLRGYLAATSGLTSFTAVLSFGFLLETFAIGAPQLTGWTRPGGATFGLIMAFFLAILLGILARYLLPLARKNRSDSLVALFGLVVLPAGLAVALGLSPMFLSLLTGVAMGLIARQESLRLQSLLLDGERLIATGLMLIAGMVADTAIGVSGLILVVCGVAFRIAIKWFSVSIAAAPAASSATQRSRYLGAVRQSYLAPIFVLSLCRIVDAPLQPLPFALEKLLTVVALTGLLSHLLPIVGVLLNRSERNSA